MSVQTKKPHQTDAANAIKLWNWLQERGGVVVWNAADFSGRSVTTPYRTANGDPYPPPGWQYPTPDRHITDPAEIEVQTTRVIETVPIKLRMGSQGLSLKVTDASARKMDRRVAYHQARNPGKEVWWSPTGDLFEHTAVVVIADETVPLPEFIARNPV